MLMTLALSLERKDYARCQYAMRHDALGLADAKNQWIILYEADTDSL